MTWTSVPWAVKGATHPAEILRLLAYAGTAGKEGVVGPTDCKVVPLSPAGTGVQVSVGAVLVLNRATTGDQQTYAAKNPTSDTVPIAATGSGSGRADLVVAMIEDPNMPGNSAFAANVLDPATGPYVFTRIVSNVPAGTTRLQDVPGHSRDSGIALARIDIPANTATITAAMIKDLRQLAMARSERVLVKGATSDSTVNMDTSVWKAFPPGKIQGIQVPSWATHASIRVDTTMRYVSGNAYANFQAFIGLPGVQDNTSLFTDMLLDATTAGGSYRMPLIIPSDGYWSVPAALRGKTVEISSRVRQKDVSGANGVLQSPASDYYFADITWQEMIA